MSLRDVLYPLYDTKVLILSSLSFINKSFELRSQQNPQNSTVSILEFENYGSESTKPACMLDIEWESTSPTFSRFVCLNLYSGSGSGNSEITRRSYSWPSDGTLFRNQMWYNDCLKLNDSHYFVMMHYNFLYHLCFLIYNNLVGYLLLALFSYYIFRLKASSEGLPW